MREEPGEHDPTRIEIIVHFKTEHDYSSVDTQCCNPSRQYCGSDSHMHADTPSASRFARVVTAVTPALVALAPFAIKLM